jgi:hypothetical protein
VHLAGAQSTEHEQVQCSLWQFKRRHESGLTSLEAL